jgi:hypothetical protein
MYTVLGLTSSVADPDPYYFLKFDPDPHRSGKLDPDPQQIEKQDPDPQQSEKVEALEGHCGAVESPNMGIKRVVGSGAGSRFASN